MSSDAPKPGAVPGWGQPQPDTAAPGPAPVPPNPEAGSTTGWGQPPVAPPPVTPAPGPAQPGWGAPPAAAPAAQGGWSQPPSVAPPAPGGGAPGAWNPQPVASSGSSGCLKVILVVVVLGVILVTLGLVALGLFANRLADSAGINGDGTLKGCGIIDNATLSDALGSKAEAVPLDGIYDVTLGLIMDKRVLPDANDCWITADSKTATGRIAKYTGGDASAVFQKERQKAAPSSQDQGGGVSVEDSGYFAGNVEGFGDEAFCTGVSTAIGAGVLVRKGTTLVYVSLSGPSDGSQPEFGTTPDGVVTAPSICTAAQAVARRMLP